MSQISCANQAASRWISAAPDFLNTHVGAIADLSYSAPLGQLAAASPPLGSRAWQTSPARAAILRAYCFRWSAPKAMMSSKSHISRMCILG
jgi:hypothetical protein